VKGSGRDSQQRSTFKEGKYACLSNIEAFNHLTTSNPMLYQCQQLATCFGYISNHRRAVQKKIKSFDIKLRNVARDP